MLDTSKLTEKLNELKGIDFEKCEREERIAGNNSVDVTLSKSFQARLAARALKCNPYDIKELPLKEYSKVVMEVMGFLFGDLGKDETPSSGYEVQPQTSENGEA